MTGSDERAKTTSHEGGSVAADASLKKNRKAAKRAARAEAKAAKAAEKATKKAAKLSRKAQKADAKAAKQAATNAAKDAARSADQRAGTSEAATSAPGRNARRAKPVARVGSRQRNTRWAGSAASLAASALLGEAAELMRHPEAPAAAPETAPAPKLRPQPEPGSIAEAAPESQPEPEIVAEPELPVEAQPVTEAAPVQQMTPEPEPAPDNAPEGEAAEPAAESQPEPVAGSAPEPAGEPELEPAAEPEPAVEPASDTAPEPSPGPTPDGELEPEAAQPAAEPETALDAELAVDAEPTSEALAEPETALDAELAVDAEPTAEAGLEPLAETEPESEPEPEPELPADAELAAEGALEIVAEAEPEDREAEPAPEPEPTQAPSGRDTGLMITATAGATVAAAIDVGSTSIHLLVGSVDSHRVTPLLDESEFLGLGARVAAHGFLGEELRSALIAALDRYVGSARELRASSITIVGTEAMRLAADSPAVVRNVLVRTGLPVHVVDHAEEGLLTLLGATGGVPVADELLLVDIGGGSSEFVTVGVDGEVGTVGLQLGTARLTLHFVHDDPPSAVDLAALRAEAARLMAAAPTANPTTILAVGGTVSNLLRMLPTTAVDQALTRRRIAVALAMLSVQRSVDAASRYLIRPERARILPAGAVIVDAVLERYGADRLRVSEAGIREGAILAACHGGVAWRDRLVSLARGWAQQDVGVG